MRLLCFFLQYFLDFPLVNLHIFLFWHVDLATSLHREYLTRFIYTSRSRSF